MSALSQSLNNPYLQRIIRKKLTNEGKAVDYTYWSEQYRELKRTPSDATTFYFEALGPNRVSLMIRAATDDENKVKERLRAILTAFGGTFEHPVKWLFKSYGEIFVSKYQTSVPEETIMLVALSLGALDVEFARHDVVRILTPEKRLTETAEILETENIEVISRQICYQPIDLVEITDQTAAVQIMRLMETLFDDEAVMDVSADFYINDLLGKKMGLTKV